MSRQPTEQSFLEDVREHRMSVLLDQGLYRHLHFAKPDDGNMHFAITTTPMHLSITGDMGSYVFNRLPDMFKFFRPGSNGPLRINPSYWAEKLAAIDRNGHVQYQPGIFVSRVVEHIRQAHMDRSMCLRVFREVRDQVLSHANDAHDIAMRSALDYQYQGDDGETFEFTDFWEHDLTDFTFHYIWCLYAIVWGIQRYDEHQIAYGAEERREAPVSTQAEA